MFYVEQTGRDLYVRLKQREYSKRTGQKSHALFNHIRYYDQCIK